MTSHKDRIEIIRGILEASRNGGTKKTQIMREVGMNSEQAKRYFPFLTGKGLLTEKSNDDNGKPLYATSDKGRDFLVCYRKANSYLA